MSTGFVFHELYLWHNTANLAGVDTGLVDPLQSVFETLGGQELQPHQDALLTRAEKLLEDIA